MQRQIPFVLFLLTMTTISSLLSSCRTPSRTPTYNRSTDYNTQGEEFERRLYTPIYQLKTELIADNLELSLLTHIHKKTIKEAYLLKEFTYRLLPNDYMASSNSTLSLQNTSDQSIEFELLSVSIEHQRLPLSLRHFTIPANESTSVPLGEIKIDLRLNTLNTRIEYRAESSKIKQLHQEKEFDMLRDSHIIKQKSNDFNDSNDARNKIFNQ